MSKYDVYTGAESDTLLLDVQADLLGALNTRMIVPLMAANKAPVPAKRLNPVFVIEDTEYGMVTQFMAAVPRSVLREPVANLTERFEEITTAIDMLIQGFCGRRF
nr:CcdB family protein [uncultured Roseovarius sp.]